MGRRLASETGLRGPLLFVGIDLQKACGPADEGGSALRSLGLGLVAAGLGVGSLTILLRRRTGWLRTSPRRP